MIQQNSGAIKEEHRPISITYNVGMGVDNMEKNQTSSPELDVRDNKEFQKVMKAGLYESLYKEGLISHVELMILMERIEKEC